MKLIIVLFGITLLAFAVIMLLMAVGVIFRGRCLRGSCGGEAIYDSDGELLNCDTCPVREELKSVQEGPATRPAP